MGQSFPLVGRRVETVHPLDPSTGIERMDEARQELRSRLQGGTGEVVVDLRGVSLATSNLMGFLLACEMECARNHVPLRVTNVSPEMLRVFRFAGLNQVMDLNAQV
jgi:anti-anti-sigma factor